MTRTEPTDQRYFITIPCRYSENPNITDIEEAKFGWLYWSLFWVIAVIVVTAYIMWGLQ